MSDLNILGHEFYFDMDRNKKSSIYLICNKCRIIIYKYKPTYILNNNGETYYYCSNSYKQPEIGGKVLNLTCNEMIIKNIIE